MYGDDAWYAKLKVWVKTLNGVPDANAANDTLTRTLKVMTNLPDENVILEVYKHQTCGPCYPAAEFNQAVVVTLPDHAVENLYTATSDILCNADAATINTLYNMAHPAPLFDRFKFPYLYHIPTGYYSLNNGYTCASSARATCSTNRWASSSSARRWTRLRGC